MNLVEQSKKYCCLQNTLIEANNLIRSKFYFKWKESQRNDWKDTAYFGQILLDILNSNSKKKKLNKVYKQRIEDGNSKKWDLTIFSNIFRCHPFYSRNILNNVQIIIDERNKLSHCTTLELSSEEFEKSWNRISNAMIRLGYDSKNLNKIKDQYLKPEITKLVNNNINVLTQNQFENMTIPNPQPKQIPITQSVRTISSNKNLDNIKDQYLKPEITKLVNNNINVLTQNQFENMTIPNPQPKQIPITQSVRTISSNNYQPKIEPTYLNIRTSSPTVVRTQPNRTSERKWSSEVCGCCDNFSKFLVTFFCFPCILTTLDRKNNECCCTTNCICLLSGGLCTGLALSRIKIYDRKLYEDIYLNKGSIIEDFCWSCFCPCCTALQIINQLEYRGEHDNFYDFM